jgi:hypothetical protein
MNLSFLQVHASSSSSSDQALSNSALRIQSRHADLNGRALRGGIAATFTTFTMFTDFLDPAAYKQSDEAQPSPRGAQRALFNDLHTLQVAGTDDLNFQRADPIAAWADGQSDSQQIGCICLLTWILVISQI